MVECRRYIPASPPTLLSQIAARTCKGVGWHYTPSRRPPHANSRTYATGSLKTGRIFLGAAELGLALLAQRIRHARCEARRVPVRSRIALGETTCPRYVAGHRLIPPEIPAHARESPRTR